MALRDDGIFVRVRLIASNPSRSVNGGHARKQWTGDVSGPLTIIKLLSNPDWGSAGSGYIVLLILLPMV